MTGFIAARGQPKPQCQQFTSVLVEHSSFWDARQFLLKIENSFLNIIIELVRSETGVVAAKKSNL